MSGQAAPETPVAWVPAYGFDGYEVSTDGRARSIPRTVDCGTHVRRIRGVELRSTLDRDGYARVRAWQNGREYVVYLHSLVLASFSGPRPEGMQCRHLNGNKLDNRPENLAWGTPLQNGRDRSLVSDETLATILQERASGMTNREVAEKHGLTVSYVKQLLRRLRRSQLPAAAS